MPGLTPTRRALTLAAVIKEPEKAVEKHAAFLRTGLDVAAGRRVWPESVQATTEKTEEQGEAPHGYARRARR